MALRDSCAEQSMYQEIRQARQGLHLNSRGWSNATPPGKDATGKMRRKDATQKNRKDASFLFF